MKLISNYQFIRLVHSKLDIPVKPQDIKSILAILIDEIIQDLLNKGVFRIFSFGKFIITKFSRRALNFQTGKVEYTAGTNNIFKFKLSKKMRRKILKNIDMEKTFNVK